MLDLLVTVEPWSTRFEISDERWARQVDDLLAELIAGDLTVRRHDIAQPGTKGAAESIILALGSAGVVTSLTSCFRMWLDRDQTRRIRARWTEDGQEQSIDIDADGLSREAMNALAAAVARRIAG